MTIAPFAMNTTDSRPPASSPLVEAAAGHECIAFIHALGVPSFVTAS